MTPLTCFFYVPPTRSQEVFDEVECHTSRAAAKWFYMRCEYSIGHPLFWPLFFFRYLLAPGVKIWQVCSAQSVGGP